MESFWESKTCTEKAASLLNQGYVLEDFQIFPDGPQVLAYWLSSRIFSRPPTLAANKFEELLPTETYINSMERSKVLLKHKSDSED